MERTADRVSGAAEQASAVEWVGAVKRIRAVERACAVERLRAYIYEYVHRGREGAAGWRRGTGTADGERGAVASGAR
ncbi:hypothetical protein GCM10010253_16920 [Streptomyces badius]|uniref:Transposase n=1 Tax=Streptomyces badius TaxID=1941 RepID=A0ABQ2SX63_STRBA|nr:hypothetical protein GCM10010253_16920 [Streptomyces badius]